MNNIEDSFYIILTSKGSAEFFPDNKSNCFQNYLAKEIPIPKDLFEVGLADISYNRSKKLFGYLPNDNVVTIYENGTIVGREKINEPKDLTFSSLKNSFNLSTYFKFKIYLAEVVPGVYRLKGPVNKPYTIVFPQSLKNIFHIENDIKVESELTNFDLSWLKTENKRIIVESDILQPQPYNEKFVKSLRMFEDDGTVGSKRINFQPVYYTALCGQFLQVIEIRLKDASSGELVVLDTFSETVVTLHVRSKQ